MSGSPFPTTAAIADQENLAAAGFAVAELRHDAAHDIRATCIGCGYTDSYPATQGRHWLRIDTKRSVGVCSDCPPYTAPWNDAHAFGPPHFDLVAHLCRQREFSLRTFGPGTRSGAVIKHIRKELIEIEAAPGDLMEWIDVAMLALDGAWRAGHSPEAIALALATKLTRNERRQWPDWRTVGEGEPIEHVRDGAAAGKHKVFARLIQSPDVGQVVVMRETGEDGPEINHYFRPEFGGVGVCKVGVSGFHDNETGDRACDTAFAEMSDAEIVGAVRETINNLQDMLDVDAPPL